MPPAGPSMCCVVGSVEGVLSLSLLFQWSEHVLCCGERRRGFARRHSRPPPSSPLGRSGAKAVQRPCRVPPVPCSSSGRRSAVAEFRHRRVPPYAAAAPHTRLNNHLRSNFEDILMQPKECTPQCNVGVKKVLKPDQVNCPKLVYSPLRMFTPKNIHP